MKNEQPMSEQALEEIRIRCNKATPGPWQSFIEGRDHESGSSFIMTGGEAPSSRGEDIHLLGATDEDQDFIAGARQDIPALLSEVSRLKKLLGVD